MRSVRVGERLDIVLISAPLCSDRAEVVDSRKGFLRRRQNAQNAQVATGLLESHNHASKQLKGREATDRTMRKEQLRRMGWHAAHSPPREIRDSLSREDAALCYCYAGHQLSLHPMEDVTCCRHTQVSLDRPAVLRYFYQRISARRR